MCLFSIAISFMFILGFGFDSIFTKVTFSSFWFPVSFFLFHFRSWRQRLVWVCYVCFPFFVWLVLFIFVLIVKVNCYALFSRFCVCVYVWVMGRLRFACMPVCLCLFFTLHDSRNWKMAFRSIAKCLGIVWRLFRNIIEHFFRFLSIWTALR